MKKNATAVAIAQEAMKNNKVQKSNNVSAAVTTHKSVSTAKVDTNALTDAEKAIIQQIDARLQDLYYLADEDDFIGFC